MNFYKTLLMLVAFMTYMIMAGLLTQIGIVIRPMSEYLNISLTECAAMFSYLTGGTLIGTIISMVVYEKISIKQVLRAIYLVFIATTALLSLLNFRRPEIISFYLAILGVSCGVGLSGGAVIISRIFDEDKRASAFIATDCAFSASGYVFPTLATMLFAAHFEWTYAYYGVAVLAILVLLSTLVIHYPEVNGADSKEKATVELAKFGLGDLLTPRVLLMGLGLSLYLFAQNTFLTWGPSYLTEVFGLSPEKAGGVVSNYWGPSIFGLITASILVNKFPARTMLLSVISIAIILTIYLSNTRVPQHFLLVTLGFGFLTSCIYKLGIAVGSQQLATSPAVLVTFLLTCGTVGSTVAPALSALIVEHLGVKSAMFTTSVAFICVLACVVACLALEKKQLVKAKQPKEVL
ncbi:TPA: MFS transporter TsgA [Serratia marcescens]